MTILLLSIFIALVACYSVFVSIQTDSPNKKLQTICISILTLALTASIAIASWRKDERNEAETAYLRNTVSRTEKNTGDIKYRDSLRFNKIDSLLETKGLRLQGDSVLVPITLTVYKNSTHVESRNQSGGQTALEITNNK